MAGWSEMSSIRVPSAESASASDERPVSSSNTLTSNTTRPLARSTVAPGLNAPDARAYPMSSGRTSGFVASRSRGAITISAIVALSFESRRSYGIQNRGDTDEGMRRFWGSVLEGREFLAPGRELTGELPGTHHASRGVPQQMPARCARARPDHGGILRISSSPHPSSPLLDDVEHQAE